MEFLGIGPLELLFILVVIIVVVGPRDIQKTARALGRGLNSLYRSDLWRVLRFFVDELRTLPNRLAREAELDRLKELSEAMKTATGPPGLEAWTPAGTGQAAPPPATAEPTPSPPATAEPTPSPPAELPNPPAQTDHSP